MALSYARLRGTTLGVLVKDGSMAKDILRHRTGDALGVTGLVAQSETTFPDKNNLNFVRAFDAALEEYTSAGVVELVREERRTFVKVNGVGQRLYTEDPTVSDATLKRFQDMFGAATKPEVVLTSVIAKHKVEEDVASKRDDVLDWLLGEGRLAFQTEIVPGALELLGYVSSAWEKYYLSPADEAAGEEPYAILYTDRFGFSTLVRAVVHKAHLIGRDEMGEFVETLTRSGATRGLFFTTASFDSEVMKYYKDPRTKGRKVAVFTGADTFDFLNSAGLV